jgi:hypothetical protein
LLAALPFVQTPEDQENSQFYQKIYETNRTHTSPYKIPPVIHFIWLGPKEFPKTSSKNIASWIEKHPGWTFKFWTDIDRAAPHPALQKILVDESHIPHLLNCYFLSDNFGEKSEILRYEILLREGGIYVDHDLFCHRSVQDLHYGFACALEERGPSILSTAIFPGTHFLAARPEHPILAETIRWTKKNWERLEVAYPGNEPSAVYNRVKHRTFSALQLAVKEKIGEGDMVFPASFFSLKEKSDAAYATHSHAGSWYKEERHEEKKLADALDVLEGSMRRTEWILFAIAGLALFGFLRRKKHAA